MAASLVVRRVGATLSVSQSCEGPHLLEGHRGIHLAHRVANGGDDTGGLTVRTDQQRHRSLRPLAGRKIDRGARLTIGTASTRPLCIRPADVADDADDLVRASVAFDNLAKGVACPARTRARDDDSQSRRRLRLWCPVR